ncbi:hypothetical protein [Lactobacillus brevis] [Lactiplantibacillus mudanjiangensis]|uniref:hypothetical protein n=1 Tax=Lactiplantibacillus mudanjiangensis TaxID=1296538 RepID=UPI001015A2AB|nr:hypothetical protein [Lactiplantibacillus mudanjiangensis]VDG32895.1 hypothetical protein [Lactobacillus brevis] [Lactiplantibacillus mudanjiangensis]
MAKWNQLVITDAGYQLSAQSVSGQQVQFTHASTTATDMSKLSSDDLKALTGIENVVQDFKVGNITVQDDHTVDIPVKVINQDLESDYLLYAIALYAKPVNGEEVMYGIATATVADLIPAQNGTTVTGTTFNFKTHIGAAASVNIVISPTDSVTYEELANHEQVIDTKITTAMNQANAYTDNATKGKANTADVVAAASNYGSANLVVNSAYPSSTRGWIMTGSGSSDASASFSVTTHNFYHNGKDNVFRLVTSKIANESESEVNGSCSPFPVMAGEKISWSALAFAGTNVSGTDVYLIFDNTSLKVIDNVKLSPSKVQPISGTCTVPVGATNVRFRIDNSGSTDGTPAWLCFTEVKVARESTPSPWSMAPIVEGSGTFDCGSNFYSLGTTSSKDAIHWSRSGNSLTLNARLTPSKTIAAGEVATIGMLPSYLLPISDETYSVCQSADDNIWLAEVQTNGTIIFLKHRSTSAGSTAANNGYGLMLSMNIVLA